MSTCNNKRMEGFQTAYRQLNEQQRRAVDMIDGPVLVVAGPGTGKTQLLTTRIANILDKTDTAAENILCLTFTESAAATMRERLTSLIGKDAYDVTISTYHSFGSDLIRRFPEYFTDFADLHPIDDLGIDSTFRKVLDNLPYSSPLKFAGNYLGDIKTFVSDAKRALLTPDDLLKIVNQNENFINSTSKVVVETLRGLQRIDKKSTQLFGHLATELAKISSATKEPIAGITPLAKLALDELNQALEDAEKSGKTTPLTTWKNNWLAKNDQGEFVMEGDRVNQKIQAAAHVYRQYLQSLKEQRLFDYDDMIIEAVSALAANADLRYSLQERYLYLLLDEFQDTNAAQAKLVQLLSDNPVSEGRPNVLAVGDDDQAIYAFQGADYSHMLGFQKMYKDTTVIPLTKNYRSHHDILHVARGIAEQIEERLHHHFPEIEKTLTAESPKLPKTAVVERIEAKSDLAQFGWTAKKIKELLGQGVSANEIAVLAPQHKYIEPLVAFLHQENIPIRYEKRENILDDPAIKQLLSMSELVLNLNAVQPRDASARWVEVLSFDFWNLPTSLIWELSWQASDHHEQWTNTLLKRKELRPIALFFIRLSQLARSETLESMLDYLVGATPLDLSEPGQGNYKSPFYNFYFSQKAESAKTGSFWQLLTNLTILRARLREYRLDDSEPLMLADFLDFVQMHREANIKILNTNPHQEAAEAVQLMTAFKSKGQEFTAVFVLALNDEVWGGKTRTAGTRLALPPNLQFIRYAGATDDERLRLFYVALTRAKTNLYLLNYTTTFAGKATSRLKYLKETIEKNGHVISPLLPAKKQRVIPTDDGHLAPTTEFAAYWQQRHELAMTKKGLAPLLKARLRNFQLSPTHINAFTDLASRGPNYFYMDTILRFPRAATASEQYGNAIHETLRWLHIANKDSGQLPPLPALLETFDRRLRAKRLSILETNQLLERGKASLSAFMLQRINTIAAGNESEYNFRGENVFLNNAHMSGTIDKLIINKSDKTLTIVDYKTGKSYQRWQHEPSLHAYRQQLYLYKLLVENSRSFKNYKVVDAYLEFVDPDDDGTIKQLHLDFDDTELQRHKRLAEVVWQHIQSLTIPDATNYEASLSGSEAFEQDLLDGKI